MFTFVLRLPAALKFAAAAAARLLQGVLATYADAQEMARDAARRYPFVQ